MADLTWVGIEPGDVGFDGGVGIPGWLIRRATGAFGHTWVYHEYLGTDDDGLEVWDTVEAGANGVQHRVRTRPPVLVVRPWRNEEEQEALLAGSEEQVGLGYGWGEFFRLALHSIGIRIKGWRDNPDRVICSNHVARSILAARPQLELTMPYPPQHIWPQRLAEWLTWVRWTTDRARGA